VAGFIGIRNLDEAHALQLDELRLHFKLSAEDAVRLAIRTAHAMHRKGTSAPECKPCAAKKPEVSPL
jgi:hypothetical protein